MSCVLLVVLKYADHFWRCQSVELSVDDLRTGRGVVLGRAVPMLRSVETQPLTGGFVLMDGRILLNNFYFFPISQIFYPIFYILIFKTHLRNLQWKKKLCPYFWT